MANFTQSFGNINAGLYEPLGYESLTLTSGTAVGITASLLEPSSGLKPIKAFCTLETTDSRFRYDGSDPTTSVGHKITVGSSLTLIGYKQLANFRVISTGADSTLKVTLEG